MRTSNDRRTSPAGVSRPASSRSASSPSPRAAAAAGAHGPWESSSRPDSPARAARGAGPRSSRCPRRGAGARGPETHRASMAGAAAASSPAAPACAGTSGPCFSRWPRSARSPGWSVAARANSQSCFTAVPPSIGTPRSEIAPRWPAGREMGQFSIGASVEEPPGSTTSTRHQHQWKRLPTRSRFGRIWTAEVIGAARRRQTTERTPTRSHRRQSGTQRRADVSSRYGRDAVLLRPPSVPLGSGVPAYRPVYSGCSGFPSAQSRAAPVPSLGAKPAASQDPRDRWSGSPGSDHTA